MLPFQYPSLDRPTGNHEEPQLRWHTTFAGYPICSHLTSMWLAVRTVIPAMSFWGGKWHWACNCGSDYFRPPIFFSRRAPRKRHSAGWSVRGTQAGNSRSATPLRVAHHDVSEALDFSVPLVHNSNPLICPAPDFLFPSKYVRSFDASDLCKQNPEHALEQKGVFMSSIQAAGDQNLNTRIVAFFKSKEAAYRAVSELHNAGFTSAEIGIIESREREAHPTGTEYASRDNESLWEKIKDFFRGESYDDDIAYDQSTEGMHWDQNRANYYYEGISGGGALVSVSGSRTHEARRILEQSGGDLRESGFENISGSQPTPAHDERRIQLRGEVLRTYKERVQRGEVRLRKEVITENQTVSVPVTREEIVIERPPATGQRASGEIGSAEDVRVPLTEERARVEKQPVVTEEVRVGKRAVRDNQQVSDKVRHEELRVEKEGDVNTNSDVAGGERKKPAA